MNLITMILACSMYSNNSITNSIIQLGSQNNAYAITTSDGKTQNFSSTADAAQFANSQISQGNAVNIGLMQIPSRWLKPYNVTATDLLRPCKNIVVATEILSDTTNECQQSNASNVQACALSMYESGDPQSGSDFANKVIAYANDHSFNDMVAAYKAKDPNAFTLIPGDVPTTITTQNAASVNPSTDPSKKVPTGSS